MVCVQGDEEGRQWGARPVPNSGARSVCATMVGRRTHQFVQCQFAVAVLVEFHQRGAGVGNFRCVDHAVVVDIERGDDGWYWSVMSAATRTTRTARSLSRGWAG